MEWISVSTSLPKEGEVVVVWLHNQKEPVCVKVEYDQHGIIWRELVPVDLFLDREDLVSHWMPLPDAPT